MNRNSDKIRKKHWVHSGFNINMYNKESSHQGLNVYLLFRKMAAVEVVSAALFQLGDKYDGRRFIHFQRIIFRTFFKDLHILKGVLSWIGPFGSDFTKNIPSLKSAFSF